MPFKANLSQLKSQLKDLQHEGQRILGGQGQNPQQTSYPQPGPQKQYYPGNFQQHPAPPPVPQNTCPTQLGGQPAPSVYWRATFNPSTPVSTEWEQKQGNNNGWGNNEVQNYTSESSNSFYTPNQLLVLRAISQPNNPDPSRKYTSARLVSHQRLSRPQGSLIATLTLPCAGGIWPAFWLLPYEPFTWPGDGEIDVAETWNGDGVNHSCLHWGFYTPQDTDKHRAIGTPVPGMQQGRPVRFEFAWLQDERTRQGRMVWWIDGRAVMKASIPAGTRPMSDFVVLLNIAIGGNVCQGRLPQEGVYDLVVHEMMMLDQPESGWARFEGDWTRAQEGNRV